MARAAKTPLDIYAVEARTHSLSLSLFLSHPLPLSYPALSPGSRPRIPERSARRRPGTFPGFFNRYCDEESPVTSRECSRDAYGRRVGARALCQWVNRLAYRSARRPTTCTQNPPTMLYPLAIQSDPPSREVFSLSLPCQHQLRLSLAPFSFSFDLPTSTITFISLPFVFIPPTCTFNLSPLSLFLSSV